MAKLSNAAMTMLMWFALQAACFRHAHEEHSEVTVDGTATLQRSKALYDDSGAEETIVATTVNTSTLQRSEEDGRINMIESENEMDIKRDFKHGQSSEDFEKDGDGEGFGHPRTLRKAVSDCAKLDKECDCVGMMCMVEDEPGNISSETISDISFGWLPCEYKKKGTECTTTSFKFCRKVEEIAAKNDKDLMDVNFKKKKKLCDRLKTHGRCVCDSTALNAGFDKRPYTLVEIIHSGQFGVVVKATHKVENHVVLAKMIPASIASRFNEPEIQDQASRIVSRVPRVYKYWKDPTGNRYFIQDFVDGEDFVTYLSKELGARRMDYGSVIRIFWQLADTMRHLHEKGIVHRDIKIDNLKYDTEKRILWLLDFGFATVMQPNQKLKANLGTREFMAPEIYLPSSFLEKHGYEPTNGYDESVDIFAMGVVLYILVFGRPPWKATEPNNLANAIADANANGAPWEGYELKDAKGNFTITRFSKVTALMKKMLAINSKNRPSAQEVFDIILNAVKAEVEHMEEGEKKTDAEELLKIMEGKVSNMEGEESKTWSCCIVM